MAEIFPIRIDTVRPPKQDTATADVAIKLSKLIVNPKLTNQQIIDEFVPDVSLPGEQTD